MRRGHAHSGLVPSSLSFLNPASVPDVHRSLSVSAFKASVSAGLDSAIVSQPEHTVRLASDRSATYHDELSGHPG
jgi:hypothetical protein